MEIKVQNNNTETIIGVFVCYSVTKTGIVVDVPGVVKHAKILTNYVNSEENLNKCT